MPLVSMNKLLLMAEKDGYAIPAFNCINLETIEAVVKVAEEEKSGVILQFNPIYYENATVGSLMAVAQYLSQRSPMPIAINLDHGNTLNDILVSIRYGFTGVMIDSASLPLSENIRIVKQIVELCHPLGISVEAAIGKMPHGKQQTPEDLADPDEAAELVQKTGVDALAPAVGNIHGSAHGEEKGSPHLDYDRIRLLSQATKIPLVLHGGSSLSDVEYQKVMECGIRKIVIFTDLAIAFNKALKEEIDNSSFGRNPGEILFSAKRALKEAARRKIHSLHSNGRYPDNSVR